ncbi:MAG: diadenylate cyclase CdaA [Planctomycetota bacterium]|nr:diadenylate cyclase CdaA [Planctomycetota bacterium]MDI6787034.1 diadenylate cyclase CdaA [Planctomycetota bacterium]
MMDTIKTIIEIGIIFFFFYYLLLSLKGTRGAGILKGVIFLSVISFLLVAIVAEWLGLKHIPFVIKEWVLPIFVLVLLVVFQPELRRLLLNLGQSRLFNLLSIHTGSQLTDEVVEAVMGLSGKKHGALIALEKEIGLKPYIEGGIKLDSAVRKELLETIFYPGSPLHDGAVVIKDERIIAAGCLFPLTDNPDIPKPYGTRHRAAIGLTEESDALTIVVSEETGKISVCLHGQIHSDIDKNKLIQIINENYK